jgi:cyclohexyl-isocyanide hydratase
MMKIAFVIFNGMTGLDFVGVYDTVIRLKTMHFRKDIYWDICSNTKIVKDNSGLGFTPTKVKKSLAKYDLIIIPGGYGTRKLRHNKKFMIWIKSARSVPLKVSVCTGALLLGSAGFLKGICATTHLNAFKELSEYCEKVVNKRIVDEGKVITARGVTSAIDLGLYLCEKLAGNKAKEKIRVQMDYKTKK